MKEATGVLEAPPSSWTWYLLAWEEFEEPVVIASGMNPRVAAVQAQTCYEAQPLRAYYLMSSRPHGGAHELATGGFRALSRLDPRLPILRTALTAFQSKEASRP